MNHILCSNLLHFECLVNVLLSAQDVRHVDYALPRDNFGSPLRIDIVADSGSSWIKVVARNSRSIRDAVLGNTGFGTKSILDQAAEYVEAAEKNPHIFKSPKVVFIFNSKLDDDLIADLERVGTRVYHLEEFCSRAKDEMNDLDALSNVKTLNLDITTLLAYVSSLTNNKLPAGKNWQFAEPILTEQAQWEQRNPVKPLLDAMFQNRRLICCRTAVNSFKEIVDLLGGPGEKQRTDEFLLRLEIMDDLPLDEFPPDFEETLNIGGKIKPRSLQIFAFGIAHKAVTVTSNEGFIRSARMKGIEVPVFVHEARALTEEKEKSAQITCK